MLRLLVGAGVRAWSCHSQECWGLHSELPLVRSFGVLGFGPLPAAVALCLKCHEGTRFSEIRLHRGVGNRRFVSLLAARCRSAYSPRDGVPAAVLFAPFRVMTYVRSSVILLYGPGNGVASRRGGPGRPHLSAAHCCAVC